VGLLEPRINRFRSLAKGTFNQAPLGKTPALQLFPDETVGEVDTKLLKPAFFAGPARPKRKKQFQLHGCKATNLLK
jgi:hypothetical protein